MTPAFEHADACASEIRLLGRRFTATGARDSTEARLASRAVVRPIDYMRWAEFEAILRMLDLRPGQRVLDVSSPQWFTLQLAARHPDVQFSYVNILESEMAPFRAIASALDLRNLEYKLGDVRQLDWPSGTFDAVISISVLEHVYPEVGGDDAAFRDIRRVLKPEGHLLLTVPCKQQPNVVYMDGPVYERGDSGKNFFAREYDMTSFHDLVSRTGFLVDQEWRIEEQPGLFAVDFWEWAEGSRQRVWPWVIRNRSKLERLSRLPVDQVLAKRYLRINSQPDARLVNVAARLKPQSAQ